VTPTYSPQSQQQLIALTEQSEQQQIDLIYFDESGFTWSLASLCLQPVGETIECLALKVTG